MTRSVARRAGVFVTTTLVVASLTVPALAAPVTDPVTVDPAPLTIAEADGVVAGELAAAGIDVRDLRYACPSGQFSRNRFRDARGGPLGLAVDCLAWYEVTTGVRAGVYDPQGTVTRGQMAIFIHRLLEHTVTLYGEDMPAYRGTSRFRDVASGAGNAKEINVLASAEAEAMFGRRLVSGFSDGSFRPADPVTREQMGTFLARALDGITEFVGGGYTRGYCRFRDSGRIATTHRDNVHLICEAGVTVGYPDGTYGPADNVTRGQMAQFLMRLQDAFVEFEWSLPPQGG